MELNYSRTAGLWLLEQAPRNTHCGGALRREDENDLLTTRGCSMEVGRFADSP
jgi:hypothetical protein